jgi:hypothetical protein
LIEELAPCRCLHRYPTGKGTSAGSNPSRSTQRWFFGFDYSLDLVVSPLIDDAEVMAAFASRYMRQTDGAHRPEHWAEIVRWAVEDVSGGLASHADSDYASADFRRIAADLAAAQAGNHALPGMSIDYHLLYLLEAASQPHTRLVEPTYVAARERLGFTEGDSQMGMGVRRRGDAGGFEAAFRRRDLLRCRHLRPRVPCRRRGWRPRQLAHGVRGADFALSAATAPFRCGRRRLKPQPCAPRPLASPRSIH